MSPRPISRSGSRSSSSSPSASRSSRSASRPRDVERDATYALSVLVAFAGVAALWWAYFDFTATAAERSLRRATGHARGQLARDVFTFFHFPMVLGIMLYAFAAKKMLEHPLDPLSKAGRWALGLGIAFFLSGLRTRAAPGHPPRRVGADRGSGGRARGGARPARRRRDRDARRRRRDSRAVRRRRDREVARDPCRDQGRVAAGEAIGGMLPAGDEEPAIPGWMEKIDAFGPVKAAATGSRSRRSTPRTSSSRSPARPRSSRRGSRRERAGDRARAFTVIASLGVATPVGIYFASVIARGRCSPG